MESALDIQATLAKKGIKEVFIYCAQNSLSDL